MINNLKSLREEKGWSILQLAAKSGVPKEIVERLEQAESLNEIEPIWVIKVARPFKMFVSEVFENENYN